MKQKILPLALGCILAIIFAGIVIHAPLTVWLSVNGASVWVKAWKEILMTIAAVLLIIELSSSRRWHTLTRDVLFWAVAAYGTLHLALAALGGGHGDDATLAGIGMDLRYVLMFGLVYGFLKCYPEWRRRFLAIIVGGALLVTGFALLQLFLPRDFLAGIGYSSNTIEPYLTVDKNPDYVRLQSTLRGPNSLGAYALIIIAGAVAYGMKFGRTFKNNSVPWAHAFLGFASLIALWASYSRSALLGTLVAIILLVIIHYHVRLSLRTCLVVTSTLLVVGIGGYLIRDSSFVHNVVLHDNPTTGANVNSNEEHAQSLTRGLKQMLEEPLGAGVGSTGSASLLGDKPMIVENQYLMVAHEVGWLGLGLFLWIFIDILMRLWRRRDDWMARAAFASGVGLAAIGLMLPVWADDTVSIIWWGLAGLVLAKGVLHERKTDKKTKRTA